MNHTRKFIIQYQNLITEEMGFLQIDAYPIKNREHNVFESLTLCFSSDIFF